MKEGPLVNELADAFGKDILCENGIDRKKLGKIVFYDPEKLKTLNKISHAHICREFDRLIAQSDAPFAVIEADISVIFSLPFYLTTTCVQCVFRSVTILKKLMRFAVFPLNTPMIFI